MADPLSRNPNLYSITVTDQGNEFEFDEEIELNFIALTEALDVDLSADLGVSEALLPRFLEGYKVDPYFVKGKKSKDITVTKEGLFMKGEHRETLWIMVPDVVELRTDIMRKLHDSPAATNTQEGIECTT